jgi:hypothetical protein
MSALNDTASVASICAGIILPLGAVGVVVVRSWLREEIVSKLSNDDTPVAKYAHDARDYSKQAFEQSQETNRLLIQHVMDKGIHERVHD